MCKERERETDTQIHLFDQHIHYKDVHLLHSCYQYKYVYDNSKCMSGYSIPHENIRGLIKFCLSYISGW